MRVPGEAELNVGKVELDSGKAELTAETELTAARRQTLGKAELP